MKFSNKANKLFLKAGWFEDRDVSKELILPIEGYPQFVIDFLNKYGNLIVFCEKQDYTDVINKIEMNPELGKHEYQEDGFYPYYSGILGYKLFPIGYYRPDSYDICCDAEGKVYKIGEYCFYTGKNLYEGIENILLMNTLQSLQLDEDTGKWWNMDGIYVSLP